MLVHARFAISIRIGASMTTKAPTFSSLQPKTVRRTQKRQDEAPPNGNGNSEVTPNNDVAQDGEQEERQNDREAAARARLELASASAPLTEWDRLSSGSRAEVEHLLEILKSVKQGDFAVRFEYQKDGILGRAGELLNDIIGLNEHMSGELVRVGKVVGHEGKLGGQADVKGVSGTWKDLTDNVNGLAANLTAQVRNIAKVTTAVAKGDLSQKITVDAKGEILELKNTINVMVDQLSSFAAEVTRVAKEVGNEGKLGGQADVRGVCGTWKDLTGNGNSMASRLEERRG